MPHSLALDTEDFGWGQFLKPNSNGYACRNKYAKFDLLSLLTGGRMKEFKTHGVKIV